MNCGLQLNASGNIEILGKSEYFRLLSTSQSSRSDEAMLKGLVAKKDSGSSFPSGVSS